MIPQEQLSLPVEGITVAEAALAVNAVDRIARIGVSGLELGPLAHLRGKMNEAIKKATGSTMEDFARAATPQA